ncbi:MFS transporter [Sphingomonas daechungensis]|uniref:MFS transporter n=1 Tax=Sphingomonas daechungensis TaxID=1176646 RepID=A0ABX6SZL4_9SPHN|nr:MFS transporter [Sphingomonas daechungensis]
MLRRLDDLLDHRPWREGPARAHRDGIRPARRNPDPHRLPHPRLSWCLGGPVRRPSGLRRGHGARAIATFLTSYAHTYPQLLVAALGVGIAGGAFSVGVTYVSKFYPKERQGLALGIFGAGNVGAAVTKFLAPFVMVAMGWQAVAQVWAGGLAVTAVLFLMFTKEDPEQLERAKSHRKAASMASQLAALKNVQVWRFALYYFFVFGAFVALALWLPRYLMGVYHLDVKTAGMLAAFYSVPASLFRIYGASCPTATVRGRCSTSPSASRCSPPSCYPIRRPPTSSKVYADQSRSAPRWGWSRSS